LIRIRIIYVKRGNVHYGSRVFCQGDQVRLIIVIAKSFAIRF